MFPPLDTEPDMHTTGTYEIHFTDKQGPGAIDRDATSADDAIAQAKADYPTSTAHAARLIYAV